MKIKVAVIITILIILSIPPYFYFRQSRSTSNTSELQTATVRRGDLKIAFAIDGSTSIDRRDLKFTVNGKVSKIAVKEGQLVKKGQLLIALDTQDVQKNLDRTLKDYMIARNNFDQTSQVTYADEIITDTIRRALDNNQYNLDKAVFDVDLRNIALKESYLYAPIEGLVSAINIKEAETTNTQSSTPVLTITTPGSIYFEAMAEDTEVLKINSDQQVSVKIDSIPNVTFPAQTDFISNLASIDTNGLATYKIKATITDPLSYNLLDGMSGQIIFTTKQQNNILIVPNQAVYRDSGFSYVNLVLNNQIQKTQVETGFTDAKEVEIISGLKQGDIVQLL